MLSSRRHHERDDPGQVGLVGEHLQVEHQLGVLLEGRRECRPAAPTSGSSRALCSSAFWMRRSMSRTASRYSVSLARSPGPRRRCSRATSCVSRVEDAAVLLHAGQPRAGVGAVAVAEQPLEHRARIVLHRQRRRRASATRSCWCRRSCSRRRSAPSESFDSSASSSDASCVSLPSCLRRDLVHRHRRPRMSAPSVFFGVHAGQERPPAARVIAGALARQRQRPSLASARSARAAGRGSRPAARGSASARSRRPRPPASTCP